MGILRKIDTAIQTFRKGGIGGVFRHGLFRISTLLEEHRLRKWMGRHGPLNDGARQNIRSQIASMKTRPLISIILPVFSVDDIWIRKCVDSILAQIYENWELCIADDCSPHLDVRPLLSEYAETDKRIKLHFRETNGHISAASNSALDLATGVFSILLDHDDLLTEDAVYWVAREIDLHPDVSMIYSDEDMIDAEDRHYSPKFKPDWSPDLFYSLNLITHLSAYRTEVLKKIGGFRLGAEGSQDYDLALRVIEHVVPDQIRHIPRILYHWRAIEGSVALSPDEKPYAHERARESIRLHFERRGVKVIVEPSVWQLHRVKYLLPDPEPRIEVISLSEVNNTAARLNALVRNSTASVICFIESDLQSYTKDQLMEIAGFAFQPDIGAVGGRIVDEYRTVVDGGLIIGANGLIDVAHKGFPADVPGYLYRNQVIGNYSAVSLSCMAMRREVFDDMGGFDEKNFPNALFDVDLCLRIRESGLRIVFNPNIEMTAKKIMSRPQPSSAEEKNFREKWGSYIENDPSYNPNLSNKNARFLIDI